MHSNTAISCQLMSLLKLKGTWSNTFITMPYGNASEADYIWTDGENTYCGFDAVWDKSTKRWKTKQWNGLTGSLTPIGIWTDGENIYYSWLTKQYILNKETDTWVKKTWGNIPTTNFYGNAIWTDGTDIYHCWDSNQCVLDRETDTWQEIDLGISIRANEEIWTDGENIYYSNSYDHSIFNKETKKFEETQFKKENGDGMYFWGADVWADGTNIYVSRTTAHYILDTENNVWRSITWNGVNSFDGDEVWTDGTNIYVLANPTISGQAQTSCILLPTAAKLYSRQHLSQDNTDNWEFVCDVT